LADGSAGATARGRATIDGTTAAAVKIAATQKARAIPATPSDEATATSAARPSAPPTCCIALRTLAAAPESAGATPPRIAVVSGAKEQAGAESEEEHRAEDAGCVAGLGRGERAWHTHEVVSDGLRPPLTRAGS
jgi:hypothetical protein